MNPITLTHTIVYEFDLFEMLGNQHYNTFDIAVFG